ncbi:MAG: preprotein translocase subunit YajC [Acidimicrobiia bacterium]|nr:preprotein translocase subunit YajC [Acidimicrobiia bacterium]
MEIIVFIVLLAVMWAALLLPQQRRAKAHRALLENLEVGDDVLTNGGIYGTITDEDDGDLFLEIASGVEIRVARGAIATTIEFEDGTATTDDADDGTDHESDA